MRFGGCTKMMHCNGIKLDLKNVLNKCIAIEANEIEMHVLNRCVVVELNET